MESVYAPSLSLPKGVPCSVFSTIEELDTQAGVKGQTLKLANLYLRQKGCLVDGRDYLAEQVMTLSKFPMKTKKVDVKDKDGKVTGQKDEPTETEGEYIKRLRASVAKGDLKIEGVTGATPEALAAAELAWEQTILDKHGPFVADAKAAERTGKAKNPPQYAMNGATAIIEKGGAASVKKWITTFKTEGISYLPFDTAPAKDADDATKAAVLATNKTNLAWAIKAREDKKAETEYQ